MKNFRLFLFILIYLSFFQPAMAQEPTYDYLIKKAFIFDGKSHTGYEADVAISHDSIAGVGEFQAADAAEVIDGRGLILAPGFIDAHTHSDFNPLVYPGLPNKIMQGVTTEIVGNCGMSAAPVFGPHVGLIESVWSREGVQILGKVSWHTFKGYREALDNAGMTTHFVGLIGHGNLRSSVMGFENRQATDKELQEMKDLLSQAMKEGAFGISFGFIYLPGTFADPHEIIELCKVAAQHSGVCAFHMRNEGSKLIESIQEVIDVAKKANARVQISHLKAAGHSNWAKIDQAFELIEAARRKGIQVSADAYPYTGSFAELGVQLPDELYQRTDRVAYFRDPSKRQEILKTLREYSAKRKTRWDSIMIAATAYPDYQKGQGKTIQRLASEVGKSPEEYMIQILADTQFEVSAISFAQSQHIVDRVISKPYVAVGSDSVADGSTRPHPRAYGSMPLVLKKYRHIDRKSDTALGEQIRRMTSVVADQFGIDKRGAVEAGYYADLVLFDPESLTDKATYEAPKLLSEGVKWVFVNGRPEVRDGQPTDIQAGQLLSRKGV